MSGMTLGGVYFASPLFFGLLALLPVAAWLKSRSGGSPAVTYASASVIRHLGTLPRGRAGSWRAGLMFFGLLSLIIALARPQRTDSVTQVKASGIDIMTVLDVSRSMLAEDFTIGGRRANRLQAVKLVTEKFLNERKSDRLGMVAFAGQAYLVSPLTLDHDWLRENLDRLRIGLVEDGTAIGSAIGAAAKRLQDPDAKSRIIVLLTDGFSNSGKVDPITAAEAAAALGIKIYTIGTGSDQDEVPMPVQDPFGRTVYQNVKTEFDEATLKRIAEIGQGQYFRATDTQSLADVYSAIDKLEKTTYNSEQYTNYEDFYHGFLLLGLSLIALDGLLGSTVWRRAP